MTRLTFLTVLVISLTLTAGDKKKEVLQRWTSSLVAEGCDVGKVLINK